MSPRSISAPQVADKAVGSNSGPAGAAAARGSRATSTRSRAPISAMRSRAEAVFVPPLKTALDELRAMLSAQTVTLETMPPDLRRQWIVPRRPRAHRR